MNIPIYTKTLYDSDNDFAFDVYKKNNFIFMLSVTQPYSLYMLHTDIKPKTKINKC